MYVHFFFFLYLKYIVINQGVWCLHYVTVNAANRLYITIIRYLVFIYTLLDLTFN